MPPFNPLNTLELLSSAALHGNQCLLVSYAQVAQLVEQRTENPRVAGSIPALGTFIPLAHTHKAAQPIETTAF